MKKTLTTKKIILALAAAILLGICITGIGWAGKHYTMDWTNGTLTVTEDPWSGYSYVVYEDHVELLEYTGNEEDVIVPDTLMGKPVMIIGEECFYLKDKIKTVHLGGNVREVEELAFQACHQLEQVTGDTELETISNGMFYGCHLLRTVDVGNHIKRIEDGAFFGCWALESIGEQPELEYIGRRAFENAGSLPDFQVPESTEVGNRAFEDSEWLRRQTGEFVVIGMGSLVAYHGDAEIVEVPHGVTKVDAKVFTYSEKARSIKEIHLPETVTEVETVAFNGCGKVRVYMPESVTKMDTLNQEMSPDSRESLLGEDAEEVIIVTTSGSYAEEYAKKFNLKYEIVEPWW